MNRYIKMARRCTKAICLCLLSVLVLWGTFQSSVAYAIGQGDLDSINNNTPFYNPNDTTCSGYSGSSSLNGSDNQEKAFNYFVGKGLTPVQSAGILGNLMEESGVNPNSAQQDGPGRGIAQWSVGGRWDGRDGDKYKEDTVYGFAGGRDVHDLAVQLDFIWWEVTEGPYKSVLDHMKKIDGTDDAAVNKATQVWMLEYESPDLSVAHLEDIRQPDARQALAKYGSGAKDSNSSASQFCGISTNFATNFLVYKQCASQRWVPGLATQDQIDAAAHWANVTYGHAADPSFNTVCNQGCGITAMAMIVANLTGRAVTPADTATYGQAHGVADPGGDGSLGDQLGPVIGGHWGLKSEFIGESVADISKINSVLRSGGLVLMGGHMESHYYQGDTSPHSTPIGPFSVGGHFVVIRALTSNGKWLVGNSGGWPNNIEYDPVWLYAHTTVHRAWSLKRA